MTSRPAPISRTILVIDDEANLRRTLAIILQRAGYSVTTAGNAHEARKFLEAGPFDLVFLDLKMPEINGLTLLPQMRRLYPGMPILILTAHATLESAIEAVRQGARDYLLKPVDPVLILSRVEEIISETRQPTLRRKIVEEIQGLLEELSQIDRPAEPGASSVPALQASDSTRYLQRGPFTLDLHARHVILRDQVIALSPTAFEYLATLVRHAPDPVSYETLVMESQGYQTTPIEARDLARWRIHELRKAIETDIRQPQFIITVRGSGYRLII